MKHTNGPWQRQKHLPLSESTLATVAHVGDWQVGIETNIKGGNYRDGLHGDDAADAALIAAAPDLLAALEAQWGAAWDLLRDYEGDEFKIDDKDQTYRAVRIREFLRVSDETKAILAKARQA